MNAFRLDLSIVFNKTKIPPDIRPDVHECKICNFA